MNATALSRRQFCSACALTTGALLVRVYVPRLDRRGGVVAPFAPNAFLRIDPDGVVTITVARPEIGQGVRTSLPMIVAEELDADWATIRIEQALDVNHGAYGDQYAGGSQSVRTGWTPLRRAGAVARAMLVMAAAQRWRVEPSACTTARGTVIHEATGRRLPYGALTAAAGQLPVPTDVTLKDPRQFTIIGQPTRQLDGPAIVHGTATYGLDVRVPGMRVAVVARAPVIGARVSAVDDTRARAIAGVRDVIRIDADAMPGFGDDDPPPVNGVAIIADTTWAALQGCRALQVTWTDGATTEDTRARRSECQRLATQPPERVVRRDGDVDRVLASAARRLDVVYEVPLLAHAPMEPMNCVVHVHDGRCDVWAPTQNPASARGVAARISGVPVDAVSVHVTRSGGGFGRRFYSDFVAEATLLSRTTGTPIQVVWTREDDIRHDFYRPASYHVMQGAIDENGHPVAWSQHLINAQRGEFLRFALPKGARTFPAGDELGAFDFPAGCVPNLQLAATALHSPVPLGQWRAVDDSTNVFVYQSFIDELAHLAGRDPLAYRLEVLGPPRLLPYYNRTYDTGRLRAVLELAAERAGWGTPLGRGRGRGIAGAYANGAYVGMVAEVEVDAQRQVRVHHVVAVADLGTVVNPLGAEAQVEGSVIFALSAALKQEITVAGGRIEQSNFTDFPVVRMSDAPRVDVHFVPSTNPPLGGGEPALPPVAPAVANAIFAATGVRVRRLPIRPADLAIT